MLKSKLSGFEIFTSNNDKNWKERIFYFYDDLFNQVHPTAGFEKSCLNAYVEHTNIYIHNSARLKKNFSENKHNR